jgi:hypothetical protein
MAGRIKAGKLDEAKGAAAAKDGGQPVTG